MMILIHLLLLLTYNVLAIDEEQKEFIMGMIKELSGKVVKGEEIPADNPLSVLLVNVKTEADKEEDQFPGHPVIHFLTNGRVSSSS